jgi:tetratricopeptide (TPR) repeat protein
LEHTHLDQDTLDRLLAQDRSEDQNRNLLHQLAVCPDCHKVGGYLLDSYRSGTLPLSFSSVDADLARSRVEADWLWEGLKDIPHTRRLSLVQESHPFASWGLCELLCQRSRNEAKANPGQAVELAELAVLVAETLTDGNPAEDRWLYQLRACAWAHLGNAFRVLGDLKRAESGFAVVDEWWGAGEEGTGDALGYWPVILDLKASLRTTQGRLSEALDLLKGAYDGYIEAGDHHLAGRVLVKRGYAYIEMDEPDQAIPVLEKAETLIDPAREPRLLLCARHNLLDNLSKAGRFAEARAIVPQVQALSRSAGSRLDHVRLRWVEARIAAGLGEAEAARVAFSEARQGFLDQGIAYDAALVSLEFAVVLLQDGRTEEVRELAAEMIPIFQSQEIHREALAALAVFQAAAAFDSATVELARDVAAFLVRARHDPELRFRTA